MENKKITLSNINEFSLQEIFEYVSNHLLSQNKKALLRQQCRYREGNLRCAAGVLISDKEYKEEFELSSFDTVCEMFFNHVRFDIVLFVTELQKIHDSFEVESWKAELYNVGKANSLNVEFLKTKQNGK